jgi:crotonobetainyl-CoA:carnitine CoA-transferase CaiB-like acyl-CoA transferase
MAAPPLARHRMLDLSRQLPGPFCSTLLADLGMDVLTVTAPGDPFGTGIPFLARNKRSMTLDLKSAAGRALFLRLARDADVVLEGFRPGVAARLGIDWETLRRDNPRLVYCAISGYGQDGPYRDRVGHDVNYLAQAGVLEFVGEAGRAPVIPGVQIADVGAGSLMAAVGILAALVARESTGRGQLVDVAMLDGAAAWNVYHVLMRQLAGALPQRGREQLTGHWPCYAVYETRDRRHVTIGAYEPHFWATLCNHVGRPDYVAKQWIEGPEREEMFHFFRDTFRKKPLAEWITELSPLDVCFAPVTTIDEAFTDPQLRHRDMVVEMDTPLGPTRFFGPPIKLSETPASVRTPPASLGEHTEQVLAELGLSADEIATLRANRVIG